MFCKIQDLYFLIQGIIHRIERTAAHTAKVCDAPAGMVYKKAVSPLHRPRTATLRCIPQARRFIKNGVISRDLLGVPAAGLIVARQRKAEGRNGRPKSVQAGDDEHCPHAAEFETP